MVYFFFTPARVHRWACMSVSPDRGSRESGKTKRTNECGDEWIKGDVCAFWMIRCRLYSNSSAVYRISSC